MGKIKNDTRQEFLKTFFNKKGYEEVEVNGFVLVKQVNGTTREEIVAIYTKDAFERYKNFRIAMSYEEKRDKPRKCKEGHIFGEWDKECRLCKAGDKPLIEK